MILDMDKIVIKPRKSQPDLRVPFDVPGDVRGYGGRSHELPDHYWSLVGVNHEIRQETLPILYSNHFWFDNGRWDLFLNLIGPQFIAALRHVHIKLRRNIFNELFRLLSHAKNLQELEIWQDCGVWSLFGDRIEDMLPFLSRYGRTDGDESDAAIGVS